MTRHVLASLVFLGALSVPASADVFYGFSYNLPAGGTSQISPLGPVTASGVLSINGSGLVTSISGLWNGASITGLIAPGSPGINGSASGYGSNDNMVYVPPSPAYVDISGLAFTVAPLSGLWGDDGDGDVNIYYDGGYMEYQKLTGFPGTAVTGAGTFQLTATPEPGFYPALALGLTGLAAARRRKRAS